MLVLFFTTNKRHHCLIHIGFHEGDFYTVQMCDFNGLKNTIMLHSFNYLELGF